MENQILSKEISRKLSALLAVFFVKDPTTMTTAEGERFLRRFGLTNQEIADVLGTTRRTIEVLKSRAQRGK